ncbi:transmembrane protein 160 isoform X2 [Sander lucioperca]|uniref:transmembrane protein 160 isoform X2 n=1 Tax=Sander lucioperca TaxID=283035 RepID=UPI00125D950C|nr:transmembrane protein 160 isoform X2 [Sander lucioperca]
MLSGSAAFLVFTFLIVLLTSCSEREMGVRGAPTHPLGTASYLGFLSWFRNGLLATGIGVIAFVQSEVGREAGYAFFILGGVCVSFGSASYIGSLFTLRRMMLLSVPALLLQSATVCSVALFWLCAVSLYIGRLEVEIIHEGEEGEDEDECRECRERREHRGYRGSHNSRHHDSEDSDGKGPNK